MSDQKISRENAVSNKTSTLVVLQDYKCSIEYDIFLHLHVTLLVPLSFVAHIGHLTIVDVHLN